MVGDDNMTSEKVHTATPESLRGGGGRGEESNIVEGLDSREFRQVRKFLLPNGHRREVKLKSGR